MINDYGYPINGTLIDISYTTGLGDEVALVVADDDGNLRYVSVIASSLSNRRNEEFALIYKPGGRNKHAAFQLDLGTLMDPEVNEFLWKVITRRIILPKQKILITD